MSGAEFKRGEVVLNDYDNARSRVRIEDEDAVQSYWLAWNMGASAKNKHYDAPDIGSQVNVLMDKNGEDGIILGARYSKKDGTPTKNGREMKSLMEGGLDFTYDKGSGLLVLKAPGGIKIETGNLEIKAPVKIEGATLTHNNKNVGSTHGHVSAPDGPPGPPVG
jgi:phage baseplate assembly protein V